jgi:hypothetical protein
MFSRRGAWQKVIERCPWKAGGSYPNDSRREPTMSKVAGTAPGFNERYICYLLNRRTNITPKAMKLHKLIATMRSIRLTFGERWGVFFELR